MKNKHKQHEIIKTSKNKSNKKCLHYMDVFSGDSDVVKDGAYPMDYYAHGSRGNWTPNHKHSNCECSPTEQCCAK